MVISRITDLDLPTGVTHIATDWQIASDLLFSNIVIESNYDQTNLTYIVFPDKLDPTVKYYGRARVLLSTGYTEWGNINVFIPKDINDIAVDHDFPSIVSLPVITTDSVITNHKPTMFTISASGYGVVGTGTHTATTWIVTDINDNIVWSSIHDINNIDSIAFTKKILKENEIYKIKVMFHSSSNDTSQIATKMIHVNKSDPRIILLNDLNTIDKNIDNTLSLKFINLLDQVEWKIVEIVDEFEDIVFNSVVTTDPKTDALLPANTLKKDKFYLMSITPTVNGVVLDTKYIPFTTYGQVDIIFDRVLG